MTRCNLTAAMMAIAVAGCTTAAQSPEGAQGPQERVFTFHSNASSLSCPALDWHIVVKPDYSAAGMIGWRGMGVIARVSGTIDPQAKTYQLTAAEAGGSNRTATISGTIISPDHITANVTGPGVNCQNLEAYEWTPSQKGPGGGR
jgi:hypothetical protein